MARRSSTRSVLRRACVELVMPQYALGGFMRNLANLTVAFLIAAIFGFTAARPVGAQTIHHLTIANLGPRSITEIYISPAGVNAWGPNRLNGPALAPGERQPFDIMTRDCSFDVRAVYEDGHPVIASNTDVCAARAAVSISHG